MDTLKNFSATLLPNGKSSRSKSITLFVTTLLLVLLISGSALAQANTLVVTAMNAGRFYGDDNPQFAGTVTGLKDGSTITVTYTSVANPGSAVGSYSIVPVLNDPDNQLGGYIVVINNGNLTVSPAPLSIVADDLTRAAGTPNPAFTGTVRGVKNGEAISATFASSAADGSASGTYPIVPTLNDASGKISNYALTISNGTLTVTQ